MKFRYKDLLQSPIWFSALILLIVFVCELAVMFLLFLFPPFSAWLGAFVDATLLTLLLFPVIYLSLLRPLFLYITKTRESEEAIKHAAEEWQLTFDSMSDAVSIHDIEYNIIKANKTLGKLLGVDPEELVGKKCYHIFHNMEEAIEVCPLKKSLLSKKPESVEVFAPRLNSWFLIAVSPIFDEQGKIRAAIHQVSDISQRKKVEESSRLAQLGKLVSSMAHEVNNPLMIISGNAQLSLMEEIQSDAVKNNLKIIMRSASG